MSSRSGLSDEPSIVHCDEGVIVSTQCKRDRLAEEAAAGQADEGDLRQSLFREVNEQIQNLNADWAVDAQDVVLCECRNRDCQEPIEITAAEYEAVRLFATRFLVEARPRRP